jgi:RNA polymerase sigma-70 factor, ECF subfamily
MQTGARSGADPREDVLVRRAVAGSQSAFNNLVELYQRRLFNYCYRMVGNADDASDATQEAFVRAYRHIGSFRVGEPFLPWLYRIAHNLCIDQLRRKPAALSLDLERDEGREPCATTGDPQEYAELSETQRLIEEAVAGLPEKYKAVLILRHGENMTLDEIAEALSLPLNTVKVQLHRAREQLKTRLGPLMEVRNEL